MLIKTSADQIHILHINAINLKGMFVVLTEREVHVYIQAHNRREASVTGKGSELCLDYQLTTAEKAKRVKPDTDIISMYN